MDLKKLCKTDSIIDILDYVDKLDTECWRILCANEDAISLLKTNVDKLDKECWKILCCNKNAAVIITNNLDKLNNECIDLMRNTKFVYRRDHI